MHWIVSVIFFSVSLMVRAVSQNHEQKILKNVLEDYIIPSYERLETKTAVLARHMNNFCQHPSSEQLQEVRESFYEAVAAWSFVEWFRVGPVVGQNTVERFFFFPDRKGISLRQLQSVIASQNNAVTDVTQIQKMSVALQGIGALDFLLFDQTSNALLEGHVFRCEFAKSVSHNMQQMAQVLSQSWKQNKKLQNSWKNPSASNHFFRSKKEAMNVMIGLLVHGLEAIRDTRMNVFLRAQSSQDRPKSAALWRSEFTMASLAANLEGLEALFKQSNMVSILPKTHQYLADTIALEFRQAIETARSLDGPIVYLLSDADQRKKIVLIKMIIDFLIDRFNNEFAGALGLTAGFSFGDGD